MSIERNVLGLSESLFSFVREYNLETAHVKLQPLADRMLSERDRRRPKRAASRSGQRRGCGQCMERVISCTSGKYRFPASPNRRLSSEDPSGSGVFLPDEVMGTVAKLNICNAFWRVMALAGDIGGGLIVTMPSLKELSNPETHQFVEEFLSFGSDEPTENIMKVHKLLQHWTAGQHGVATWHGAGPVMAQKMMLQRTVNFDREKELVKRALKLEKKEPKIEN